MAKIWLKSPDPNHQCCGCESKVGPCDACCSITGTNTGLHCYLDDVKNLYDGNCYGENTTDSRCLGCGKLITFNPPTGKGISAFQGLQVRNFSADLSSSEFTNIYSTILDGVKNVLISPLKIKVPLTQFTNNYLLHFDYNIISNNYDGLQITSNYYHYTYSYRLDCSYGSYATPYGGQYVYNSNVSFYTIVKPNDTFYITFDNVSQGDAHVDAVFLGGICYNYPTEGQFPAYNNQLTLAAIVYAQSMSKTDFIESDVDVSLDAPDTYSISSIRNGAPETHSYYIKFKYPACINVVFATSTTLKYFNLKIKDGDSNQYINPLEKLLPFNLDKNHICSDLP